MLDCEGRGTVSQVVAGLDWIARWHTSPAVVTMSLGTQDVQGSEALDYTVRTLVHDHNVTVVVAAGNSNSNSCMLSPGEALAATLIARSYHAPVRSIVVHTLAIASLVTAPCSTTCM